MTALNFLHPFWTPALSSAFAPIVSANAHGREAVRAAYATLPDEHRVDLARVIAAGRLPMLATSAFVLPVLSPEGCEAILARSEGYDWRENIDAEDEPYRMKEAVLAKVDPDYHSFIRSVLMTGASPWMLMITGRLPSVLETIQLAQYSADERAEGCAHIDRNSDYSVVINLNPGDYEGGSLIMRDGLIGDFEVPKLPTGYGLFFDGSKVMHHGAKVTKGTKKILVVWASTTNDKW